MSRKGAKKSPLLVRALPLPCALAPTDLRSHTVSCCAANCGKTCLVPAYYGACPSNDTTCLCSTPSVVQDVGSCVIKACTVQTERDATIAYMLGVCQSFVRRPPYASTSYADPLRRFQGITVSVPSAIATFIPSTLVPAGGSHAQVPTSTPTIAAATNSAAPPGPGVAATAGAVTAAVAAIFFAVVALVCWRRRYRRCRPHRAHHGGILGGMGGWRKGLAVDRTDTVKSFFAGKEEGDDSSRGLLSSKSPRYWAPQRPSDARSGYAALGGRTAAPPVPVPPQHQHQPQHQYQNQNPNQLSPPQPPPSHLKPAIWVGIPPIPDDRARRAPSASATATGPGPSPAHSRAGSADRYLDGLSPATSHLSPAVSISTPFWGARPSFAGWDGSGNGNGNGSGNWGTPPSSASSPGAVPEKQRAWGWERRAATEGSSVGVLHPLPALPAAAGASTHSGFGTTPQAAQQAQAQAQAARGHRRILTIDTTNINIEVLRPKSAVQRAPLGIAVAAPAPNPNPNPNPNPYVEDVDAEDALATTAAELGRMFAADTTTDASASSLSGHEIREAIRQRYHTSPTDGAHGDGDDDACSPAVPESASMEMYGIGFGVMGRRWEPRSVDVHASTNASVNNNGNASGSAPSSVAGSAEGKRSAKSVRGARPPPQVPGLRRFQSQVLTTRAAAVLSTFAASPSRSRTPSRTPSHRSSPSPSSSRSRSRSARATPALQTPTPEGGKEVVSTGTIASLIGGYGIAPTPSPSTTTATPAATPQGGGGGVAAAPGRDEGGGEDEDEDEGAPLVPRVPASADAPASSALSSLTPRRAPPRYSVVPQDFSEDGHGLSRDGTRRW